jgi:hypothetical protein
VNRMPEEMPKEPPHGPGGKLYQDGRRKEEDGKRKAEQIRVNPCSSVVVHPWTGTCC